MAERVGLVSTLNHIALNIRHFSVNRSYRNHETLGLAYNTRTQFTCSCYHGVVPAASLALYRRHLGDCRHISKGNRWTRCQCLIWVHGSIGDEAVRRSLNTTNWTAASTTVHGWQVSGRIGVLRPDAPTVEDAVKKFLDEAAARNLAPTTIKKRRELLEGKL